MIKTVHGIVNGKTIELDEELGVADGQKVEIRVNVVPPSSIWGEGIRRSAGGWADYPEMDAIMERILRERKVERRPQLNAE